MDKKEIVRTSIYIDKDLYKELKYYCIEHNLSVKDFINNMIEKELNKSK